MTQCGNDDTVTARLNLYHTFTEHAEVLAAILAAVQCTQTSLSTGGILLDLQANQVSGQQAMIANMIRLIRLIGDGGRSRYVVGILSTADGADTKDELMLAGCFSYNFLGFLTDRADVFINTSCIAGSLLNGLIQNEVMTQCRSDHCSTLLFTAVNANRVLLAILSTGRCNGNTADNMGQLGSCLNDLLTAGIYGFNLTSLCTGCLLEDISAADSADTILEGMLTGCRNQDLLNQDGTTDSALLAVGQTVLAAGCRITGNDYLCMTLSRDFLSNNQSTGVNGLMLTGSGAGCIVLHALCYRLAVTDQGIQTAFVLRIGNDNFLITAALADTILKVMAQSLNRINGQDLVTGLAKNGFITILLTGCCQSSLLILMCALFTALGALTILAPDMLALTYRLFLAALGADTIHKIMIRGTYSSGAQYMMAFLATLSNVATFNAILGINKFGFLMLTVCTTLVALTGSPIPFMLTIGIRFLHATDSTYAILKDMILGTNGSNAQNMVALFATLSYIAAFQTILGVDKFRLSVLTVNATLVALTGSPIPFMLTIGIGLLCAANSTYTILKGMRLGCHLNRIGIGMATSGTLLGDITAISTYRINQFVFRVVTYALTQLALAGSPVPNMDAILYGLIRTTLSAGTILKGMLTRGNRSEVQGLVAICTTLSNIATFQTVGINELRLAMLTEFLALGACAGGPIPLMLAGSSRFFPTALDTNTIYICMAAGLNSLVTGATHCLMADSTAGSHVAAGCTVGVLLLSYRMLTLCFTELAGTV